MLDPSGAPVANASVSLHQTAGSALLQASTSAGGQFSFTDVAAGEYLIDVAAPGLAMEKAEVVRVESGTPSTLTLRLAVQAMKSEVSVTSASEPQSVDQVSKALDIVDAKEAERRGLFSVADSLRFVPSLRVSTRGSPGTFTTIQIRGLRTTDTAILIDGFPFRDVTSIQDEASAYIGDLLLVDASRVEVLRGSGSSLYGTNAMGGVINIITEPGGGKLHGDLDLQGGGLGLFHGLASVAGGALHNRFTYSGGVSSLNVTNGVDDAGAVRDWSGHGGVAYALTPKIRLIADVFANAGFLQENASPETTVNAPTTGVISAIPLGSPGATFVPSLGDSDAGRYSHFVNSLFKLQHEVNSRLSYKVAYGIVASDRNNTNGPAGPGFYQPVFSTSDRYDGRVDTVQARADYVVGPSQILTAGYEFQQEHYRETASDQNPDLTARTYTRVDAHQRSQAAFAQDQFRFLKGRLQVLLSGRFSHFDVDQPVLAGGSSPYAGAQLQSPPNAYTGDASVSYFISSTSTKLRSHTGNSYRAPSIYERFGGYFFGGLYSNYGDPRLSPERAISVDAGIDQYLFRDHLKVSGTYFYAHLQQVIGFLDGFAPGYVDPYGRFGGYNDTSGGISRGVELNGDFRPLRQTTIRASYTYTNAADRRSQYFTGTATDPIQTPRILPNSVTVEAAQTIGRHLDFGLDFEGGSKYLYPLFSPVTFASQAYRFEGPRLLGLSAGFTMPLGEQHSLRLYTRVSNALGQSYYEDGFRTPSRWAVAGIHLSF